jgi:hypothetical protein
VISAIGAALILAASIAIANTSPNPGTRVGHHPWAGILADTGMSFV